MTTIATWNVNSLRTRLEHLKKWVAERDPDVILLQELKCQEEHFPKEEIEDLGYNVAILGQKSYNGVAILSKSPLDDVVYGLPTFQEDDQARYIEAFVDGVRVASVYVPNGQEVGSEKFAYKMKFLDALRQHGSDLLAQNEPLVIAGDYNIAPFVSDGHSPERFKGERILCSLQERETMRSLYNTGFIDGFRLKHPDTLLENQGQFSWWDYRSGSYQNNKGYRIDHLLLSPKAADLLQDAGIDHETRSEQRPSDHAPVWGTLSKG